MIESYRCIIVPNLRTFKTRSTSWTVVLGPHVIEDHTTAVVTGQIIHPGTEAVEYFRIDKAGRRRVYETHLPGGIVVKGSLNTVRRGKRRT